MSDLNILTVTGRLTNDANFRTLASGKKLLSFNMANNIGYGDFAKTNFYVVNQWGDRGEKLVQYLKKGTHVAVSGEESLNEWKDKEGNAKQDRVITTSNIQLLGSAQERGKAVEEETVY